MTPHPIPSASEIAAARLRAVLSCLPIWEAGQCEQFASLIEQQAAEIQRLRAALMAIGAWKHPDQPEHPLQRMAREALRDERRDSDMIGQFGE